MLIPANRGLTCPDRSCDELEYYEPNDALYFALGIIALSFPVMIVSNRTYVAPAGRESEFPPTRVATRRWRDLYGNSIAFVIHSLDHSLFIRLILQKTQFLTAHCLVHRSGFANQTPSGGRERAK